ncbi:MAG: aspartate aminotransferase family protein [Candidatus Lokiarchaeota archaeon]|nr:aspartate aminotransferase family protein [Candidatus Lokiarchaeota archaeon]
MTEHKIIGSLSQKELVKLYSKYISKPKAEFFKSLGLGAIQGKREGIYIHMLEGIRKNTPPMQLIDCRTSGGVFNLGHGYPKIIEALKRGIEAGLDIGDHHLLSEQRALLAKNLAELMPGGITNTQFCVGGGEAIDLAIKLSRSTTKRKKILSAKTGYHGVTGVALGAGNARFKDAFMWNLPDYQQVTFGDIEEFEKVIDEETACVILETIPATGGILIPEEGYFTRIRELCDELGVIMIADEVQTGLGRTGELWGIYGGLYPHEKIVPDIIVLAKGMSSSVYPIATCSYKSFIGEVFEQDPFIHISTTGGSELGCYVTRTMLDIISAPEFLEHVRKISKEFEKGLLEFKNNPLLQDIIVDVRGRGLMWGMEFPNHRYGVGMTLRMIENGIFADYCGNKEDTIKLMPPLILNSEDVSNIMHRLEKALLSLPKPNKEEK